MVARSRGVCRSSKCDSSGRKTNPYRPPTSQQQESPACTAIAERGHRRVTALGVLRRMSQPETQSTRHWAPVFGRHKAASGEIRMITDLRQLNSAWVQPPKFKTDNWHPVGECLLLNPHLTWGALVDLSNFFFHLGLHPSAGRWIRIKMEMGEFQWTALHFGLHCSPYWTGQMAQVVEKTLRRQGVHLIWYVNDILILGESQQSVSTILEILLQT